MARRSDGTPGSERVAAHFTGLSAESRAAAYVIAKGYRIVAWRFRTLVGEVDIVARRRGVLVFVEVKARNLDDAAFSLLPRQQQRIAAAARAWLAAHPEDGEIDIRFDAALVAPGRIPGHPRGIRRQLGRRCPPRSRLVSRPILC